MTTIPQLKAQRRKAFRLALKQVKVVQRLANQNHRDIIQKLYQQRLAYLDIKDAQKVIAGARAIFEAANSYAANVASDFTGAFTF